jgi:hypothetical protein
MFFRWQALNLINHRDLSACYLHHCLCLRPRLVLRSLGPIASSPCVDRDWMRLFCLLWLPLLTLPLLIGKVAADDYVEKTLDLNDLLVQKPATAVSPNL